MISSKMAGHGHHRKAHNETVWGGGEKSSTPTQEQVCCQGLPCLKGAVPQVRGPQSLKSCASRSFLGAGREEHSCCSKAQRCPSYGLLLLPGCVSQTSTMLLASICPISNGASHTGFPNSGGTGPFLPVLPMRLIVNISSMAAQRLSEHHPLCPHFTGLPKELP